MAYDEYLAERISQNIKSRNIPFQPKKMMGGIVFMVNNKMCCGTHIDKKYGDSLLMLKISKQAYANVINNPECLPMDFTGRPMKGFIFITPDGFDMDKYLEYLIDHALTYNKNQFG